MGGLPNITLQKKGGGGHTGGECQENLGGGRHIYPEAENGLSEEQNGKEETTGEGARQEKRGKGRLG